MGLQGWEKLPQKYRIDFSNTTEADLAKFPADFPEVQIMPIPSQALTLVNDTANYMSFFVSLQTTTSRGSVTISTPDTADNPVIDLNWFSTETDRQLAIASIRRLRDFAAAHGNIILDEFAPGASVQSDEDIMEFIRNTATLVFHATSGCMFTTLWSFRSGQCTRSLCQCVD